MHLSDLPPSELLALVTLVDQHQAASGDADAPRWRALVHDEVVRRFRALDESRRMMEEARAARGG